MSEELSDPTPPSASRIAQRALVLSAVTCRGLIEEDSANQKARALQQTIVEWLERLDLTYEAEGSEIKLLKKPLGTLSKKEAIDAGWKAEALSITCLGADAA